MCSVASVFHRDLCGPLQPMKRLIVDFNVPADVERFTINFHKDENNILFHFDPRFNYGTCQSLLVCNIMQNGEWGIEDRFAGDEHPFPFTPGRHYTVAFEFGDNEFVVFVNDSPYITFKCRAPFSMQDIHYFEVFTAEVRMAKVVKLL
ncbi:galectin-1-like [Ambystoma mexicanum]|uniref:galectin-1-like n=1 Tax=Ambystoma mexicanum TaxID=8296 RepID=UPI0037E7D263